MDAGQARQTAADPSLPGIVRATALSLLGKDAADEAILLSAANDEDGLVRFGAARASGGFAEAALGKLLNDTVLAVRVNAARALAGTPAAEKPLAEWKAAEKLAADRPETHANLGGLYADLGDLPHAKAAFATALRLDPDFVPALIDLGDVGRLEHDERASETWLRRAVAAAPDNETAWYALGLCLVRQHRAAEASDALRRAGILR
jgi:tetratricopeptide (TPR) repeat protein